MIFGEIKHWCTGGTSGEMSTESAEKTAFKVVSEG